MKIFIKVGVIVLVLILSGVIYAGGVMREGCKTRYNELNTAQTDAQRDYMKAKKALRTSLGKMDSQEEANAWEEKNKRLTDDYNNKVKNIKEEMQSLYNDPNCWE